MRFPCFSFCTVAEGIVPGVVFFFFLLISYIKFSLTDVLQIHCSAPLLTVEVFFCLKAEKCHGKMEQDVEI